MARDRGAPNVIIHHSSHKAKFFAATMNPIPLPVGITSRQIDIVSLSFHILEAGDREKPLIILLHGFPELAYSWRKCMPLLAAKGFYVVAPDQRGYGRTKGWDNSEYAQVDLTDFSITNLVRDIVCLIHTLGHTRVKCLVGHDFGAVSAAYCALARPDLFDQLVLMAHPYKGAPTLNSKPHDIETELTQLGRKHYKWYYSTQSANHDMLYPLDGLAKFLRGYFHLKSADWEGNNPEPLKEWSGSELARMPRYYIMDKEDTMRDSVAKDTKGDVSHSWLSEEELQVYVNEWKRNGFQGGLNWYRVQTNPAHQRDALIFVGKTLEVPCLFVGGRKDWATYQEPGVIEKMGDVCADFRGVVIVDGAGHWLPQEKPQETVDAILKLIES